MLNKFSSHPTLTTTSTTTTSDSSTTTTNAHDRFYAHLQHAQVRSMYLKSCFTVLMLSDSCRCSQQRLAPPSVPTVTRTMTNETSMPLTSTIPVSTTSMMAMMASQQPAVQRQPSQYDDANSTTYHHYTTTNADNGDNNYQLQHHHLAATPVRISSTPAASASTTIFEPRLTHSSTRVKAAHQKEKE